MKRLLLPLLILGTLGLIAQTTRPGNNIRVIAYYSGGAAPLDNFDVAQMTHIIFCFGQLEGNKLRSIK